MHKFLKFTNTVRGDPTSTIVLLSWMPPDLLRTSPRSGDPTCGQKLGQKVTENFFEKKNFLKKSFWEHYFVKKKFRKISLGNGGLIQWGGWYKVMGKIFKKIKNFWISSRKIQYQGRSPKPVLKFLLNIEQAECVRSEVGIATSPVQGLVPSWDRWFSRQNCTDPALLGNLVVEDFLEPNEPHWSTPRLGRTIFWRCVSKDSNQDFSKVSVAKIVFF